MKASIQSISGDLIEVLREDGQLRIFNVGSTLIKALTQEDVDLGEGPGYVNTMIGKPFKLEEFNVTIEEGTGSHKIEEALLSVTRDMNSTPLQVNRETWTRNTEAQQKLVDGLVAECRRITGNEEFRPNAAADCIKEFYEVRSLPIQGKSTKSGRPTMDKATIGVFAAMGDELAPKVIEAREAMSILSQLTAWEPYATVGKVQTNWNQFGTPMGRYTSDSPNLQNRVTQIRETVEAPDGWMLISADLGQAEYVTWASLSQDPVLSKIFASGLDLHQEMYENVKALVPELKVPEEAGRKFGKTLNFAILYLMTDFALAKQIGVSVPVAAKIINAYKTRVQVAAAYIEEVLREAERNGWVRTHYGRERAMPELKRLALLGGRESTAMHEARKTAWHHHNAGTAAELLKIKQVRTVNALKGRGLWHHASRVALNMHDELILLAKEDQVEEVKDALLEAFHQPIRDFLPFKVDCRVGKNWLEISK